MTYDHRVRSGEVLDARFRIEAEAGAGGMGLVFRAHDLHTGRDVAVKIMKGDRVASARFRREARLLAQLRHPAIVGYVAHGAMPNGTSYLAMEWLDGEDLAARLERGPLAVPDALSLAKRVADALSVAHGRGIVHRDLKPSNLFLAGKNVRDVRLLDFGIARAANPTQGITAVGSVVGTPGYMSPEQVRGDDLLDARSDVFSLGCVLFECLSGQPAFTGESVMALLAKILMDEPPRVFEVLAGIAPPIDDVVFRMLAKNPKDRLADGAAVRDAIASIESFADSFATAAPARVSAITRTELRVVSVVMAAGGAPASDWTVTVTEELSEPQLPDSSKPEDAASSTLPELARTMLADAAPFAAHDVLGRLGAHVDRLADGSIVATLQGVESATDQAAQAARCALALRALAPQVPIALVTGRTVLIGRAPIGALIERAAKLLRVASRSPGEPARIHLDDVTAGLLPSRFKVANGAAGPELTGEEQFADVARTVLGRAPRFVGRAAEMGTLTGMYAQVESEHVARAVVVTGAAGLGKSRLRAELSADLAALDERPEIWLGSAEPFGAGTPFGMIARVLRAAFGPHEGPKIDRDRIVERVGRHVPAADVLRVATFLGELTGAPLDAAPALPFASAELHAARREPPLMADQMQRAVVDFLRGECAVTPVVLVLEDAHWADAPTMKLLDVALRDLAERALFVVAFARSDIEDAHPGLWSERGVFRLALAPLTARPAEQLARDILGPGAEDSTIRRVVLQAAGNPFFLEELLRALHDGPKGTMPETLLAIVQKRLEAHDESTRRLLRAASVCGEVFWRGALETLLGNVGAAEVTSMLGALIEREVIVRHPESRFSGETEYAFRHALVRDAAYQMLTDADRVAAHRLAGAWLAEIGEISHALLAEHFERGGDEASAARSYAFAAGQSLRADDLDGCLRLAKRGLDLAKDAADVRGALHLARAEAFHWRAEYADARAEAAEALHLLDGGSDAWFAASEIAIAGAATLGDLEEAAGRAKELISAGTKSRPAFLMAVARAAAFLPAGPVGDELFGLLPDASSTADDPWLAARVHVARAIRAQAMGDRVGVLDEFVSAAKDFEHAGDRRGARAARGNAGYAYTELGRHEEAVEILRHALEDAQRAGARGTAAWSGAQLGLALGRLGRAGEALAQLSRSRELARKQGNRNLVAEIAITVAEIHDAASAYDLALHEAESAHEAEGLSAGLKAAAASALAIARLGKGDVGAAHAAAREAIDLVETNPAAREAELVARLAFARTSMAAGDRSGAMEALRAAEIALHARAQSIVDVADRERFLREVPVNDRILRLRGEWSSHTG